MDVSYFKLLESVKNLEDYRIISENQFLSNICIQLNASAVKALMKCVAIEVEYFAKYEKNGANIKILHNIIQLPPSINWNRHGQYVISFIGYWMEEIKKKLIYQNNWWTFLKVLMHFIQEINLKSNILNEILVKETAESLLHLATLSKLKINQMYQVVACFNTICRESSINTRLSLTKKLDEYLIKLSTKMASCGDFNTQFAIMETLACWLINRRDPVVRKEVSVKWFPTHLYSEEAVSTFLNASWEYFYEDAKAFLHAHNKGSEAVISLYIKRLLFGSLTLPENEASNPFLDINSGSKSITLMVNSKLAQVIGGDSSKCRTLTITEDNTTKIQMLNRSTSLIMTITVADPFKMYPSEILIDKNSVCIEVSHDNRAAQVDVALRNIFDTKYEYEYEVFLVSLFYRIVLFILYSSIILELAKLSNIDYHHEPLQCIKRHREYAYSDETRHILSGVMSSRLLFSTIDTDGEQKTEILNNIKSTDIIEDTNDEQAFVITKNSLCKKPSVISSTITAKSKTQAGEVNTINTTSSESSDDNNIAINTNYDFSSLEKEIIKKNEFKTQNIREQKKQIFNKTKKQLPRKSEKKRSSKIENTVYDGPIIKKRKLYSSKDDGKAGEVRIPETDENSSQSTTAVCVSTSKVPYKGTDSRRWKSFRNKHNRLRKPTSIASKIINKIFDSLKKNVDCREKIIPKERNMHNIEDHRLMAFNQEGPKVLVERLSANEISRWLRPKKPEVSKEALINESTRNEHVSESIPLVLSHVNINNSPNQKKPDSVKHSQDNECSRSLRVSIERLSAKELSKSLSPYKNNNNLLKTTNKTLETPIESLSPKSNYNLRFHTPNKPNEQSSSFNTPSQGERRDANNISDRFERNGIENQNKFIDKTLLEIIQSIDTRNAEMMNTWNEKSTKCFQDKKSRMDNLVKDFHEETGKIIQKCCSDLQRIKDKFKEESAYEIADLRKENSMLLASSERKMRSNVVLHMEDLKAVDDYLKRQKSDLCRKP